MKRLSIRAVLPVVLAALCGVASAVDTPTAALLEKYRCTICHSDREAGAGPAWVDIATHYRGDQQAVTTVANKIQAGVHGGGPWHMPPHPEVSKANAAAMARYILAVKP